jgi:hypothetical protein
MTSENFFLVGKVLHSKTKTFPKLAGQGSLTLPSQKMADKSAIAPDFGATAESHKRTAFPQTLWTHSPIFS